MEGLQGGDGGREKKEEVGEGEEGGGRGRNVGVAGLPHLCTVLPGQALSHRTHTCPACPIRICSRRGSDISLPILVSVHSTGSIHVALVPPLGSSCLMQAPNRDPLQAWGFGEQFLPFLEPTSQIRGLVGSLGLCPEPARLSHAQCITQPPTAPRVSLQDRKHVGLRTGGDRG